MVSKKTGRWALLLLASFIGHVLLTVNSTATALWNEQGRSGRLLSQQLADAAAPLALAHDRVSLSVLASRYDQHPAVSSLRLYDVQDELLATTGGDNSDSRLFTAPLQLQQQALGRLELRLHSSSRADILRLSMANIGLSALLHLLLFLAGLLLMTRQPGSRQPHGTPRQSASVSPAPLPDTAATALTPPVATTPPAAPATCSLLHIALDDANGLLARVNAQMADDMLSLFDQLIDRAAQLYGGSVLSPFSPEGVLLRFNQDDAQEQEQHALAAAALFLQLVEASQQARRPHGLLCLGAKAGLMLSCTENDDTLQQARLLAQMAPAGRILCSAGSSDLQDCCLLGQIHQFEGGQGQLLRAQLVDDFVPEYRQLIWRQSQQILLPAEVD